MIKAPDDLYAIFETQDGKEIFERVIAFADNGTARVLDLRNGELVAVWTIGGLTFKRLIYMLPEQRE